MIDYFRILREPETPVLFEAGSPLPESVEHLHFNVRKHRRWYPRGRHQASNPNDRIYLEPVPLQPCTWEEILRACETLESLHRKEREAANRHDVEEMEREAALRALGRFLRWVGLSGGASATDLRTLATERERRWALESLGSFLRWVGEPTRGDA
jgi:hypothetical protein